MNAFLEHWLSTSQVLRKTSQEYISLERQRREEYFLGYVPRAEGGWSGDLMIADFEDLQESEASEVFAIRFTNP